MAYARLGPGSPSVVTLSRGYTYSAATQAPSPSPRPVKKRRIDVANSYTCNFLPAPRSPEPEHKRSNIPIIGTFRSKLRNFFNSPAPGPCGVYCFTSQHHRYDLFSIFAFVVCTTKRLSHEVTKASRGTHPIKPWTSWVMIGYMSSLRPVPTIRVCSSPLLVGSYLVVIYVSFTCHWDLNRPRHPHLSSFCACACVEIHNRLVTPRHVSPQPSRARPSPWPSGRFVPVKPRQAKPTFGPGKSLDA